MVKLSSHGQIWSDLVAFCRGSFWEGNFSVSIFRCRVCYWLLVRLSCSFHLPVCLYISLCVIVLTLKILLFDVLQVIIIYVIFIYFKSSPLSGMLVVYTIWVLWTNKHRELHSLHTLHSHIHSHTRHTQRKDPTNSHQHMHTLEHTYCQID